MEDTKDREAQPAAIENTDAKETPFTFLSATLSSSKHPERNEDAIAFPFGDEKGANWAAVLDGVGGQVHGDLASKTATEHVSDSLAGFESADIDEVQRRIEKTISEAHLKINQKAPGSATTITLAKFIEKEGKKWVVIAHVGDSRAYILRDRELFRLTQDDSPIPEEVGYNLDEAASEKDLTDQDRVYFRRRNLITQSVGGADKPHVQTQRLLVLPGDKIVLTTDGIHDNLTRKEIQEAVQKGDDEANSLTRMASLRSQQEHFRSKKDDMSAVVVRVN